MHRQQAFIGILEANLMAAVKDSDEEEPSEEIITRLTLPRLKKLHNILNAHNNNGTFDYTLATVSVGFCTGA